MQLGCQYLFENIYLAPNEIRTCCKRYHVNNELKGDVVLQLDLNNISLATIIHAKKEILQQINSSSFGSSHQCHGCPWLKEYEPGKSVAIKYISFELHSVCNMRCTYCSDTYYGGLTPSYDFKSLLCEFELYARSLPQDTIELVFGGGEPTLYSEFANILTLCLTLPSIKTLRIFTNASVYNPLISEGLASRKVAITTSIDAGSEDLFTKIRGLNALNKVLINLNLYSRVNPDLVTVKYILTEENIQEKELALFASNILEYDLCQCSFQISSDFKTEMPSADVILAARYLANALEIIGVKHIIYDDHLSPRILASQMLEATDKKESSYIVWGAGEHSRRIFERIGLDSVEYFVDQDASSIKKFMSKNVYPPSSCYLDHKQVFIGSVQSFPQIAHLIYSRHPTCSIIKAPW